MHAEIEQYTSAKGTRIYRIPLSLFPGMSGFAHLIIQADRISLFDVGSGFGDSNSDLENGLEWIASRCNEKVSWDLITNIYISHGHIDHYGGLHFVRERTNAPIVIHELDRRVLTDYEQRLNLVAERLRNFLVLAGLPESDQEEVMTLYLLHKQLFSSIEIQASYEQIGMQAMGIRFEHVPGHCPGHVIAWIDDILLSGDHILRDTSPHQAPESLSLNMGLEHYLESLAKLLPRANQARWTLGGHEGPIDDLEKRIIEISRVHQDRLGAILRLLDESRTLYEITRALYPETEGYHRLLAIEEVGAHLEYLHLRGYIGYEHKSNHPWVYTRLSEDSEFPGFKKFRDFSDMQQEVDLTGMRSVT